MRALVLSGGGVKGAYQAGALKHILGNLDFKYDIICGISVGALNAAFISMFNENENKDASNQLLDIWLNLKTEDVYKRWFPFGKLHAIWKNSIYDSRPLMKLVRGRLDRQKIVSTNRSITVGAVSLTTGRYKLFTQNDDDFVDGVLASSAFPVFMTPVKIDDELYTDGGVKEITPLQCAIDQGADTIEVIMCSPIDTTKTLSNNAKTPEIAMRTINLMSDEIVKNDLQMAMMYNELVKSGARPDKKEIKITIISPDTELTDDSLDFDNSKIIRMMDRGYEDAVLKLGK
jgi:NTE family protein